MQPNPTQPNPTQPNANHPNANHPNAVASASSSLPLGQTKAAAETPSLVGPWQTNLRADIAALAQRRLTATMHHSGQTQIEIKGNTKAAALTMTGVDRSKNSANYLLLALPPRGENAHADMRLIAAVVQGNEDDEASAVAGMIVLDELATRFRARAHWDVQGGGLAHALSRAIDKAHARVLDVSTSNARFDLHWSFCRGQRRTPPQDRDTFRGIATSVTAVALCGRVATFAHVGTTAALLIRDGDVNQVERITPDHSLSALPSFSSTMRSDDDRARFGGLSRSLVGRERELEVVTMSRHLRGGDTVVLATGALTRDLLVDDSATAAAVDSDDTQATAQRLSFLCDDDARDLGLVVMRPLCD